MIHLRADFAHLPNPAHLADLARLVDPARLTSSSRVADVLPAGGGSDTALARLVTTGAELLLALVIARVLLALALGVTARMLSGRPQARWAGRAALRISPAFARTTVRALACSGLALSLAAPAVAVSPPNRPSAGSAVAVPVLDRLVVPLPVEGTTGRHPPATGPRPPTSPPPAEAPRARTAHVHLVRRGESLWSIASDALGPQASPGQVARSWPRWFIRNRGVVGPDPDRLLPGQRLHAPSDRPSSSRAPERTR